LRWESDPDPIPQGREGFIYSQRDGTRVRRAMTADELAASRRSADAYFAFMDRAEAAWSGPITALRDAGMDGAGLWQTGGMCLAIGVNFGDGHHLMLTDAEGPLSPSPDRYMEDDYPADLRHWVIGVYTDDESDPDGSAYVEWTDLDVTVREHDAELASRVAAVITRAATGCAICGTKDTSRFHAGHVACMDCEQ
jgi:hypothetical protein